MSARRVVLILGILSLAPTPGDTGGCGQQANELNPASFAVIKKNADCQRCTDCGFATSRCATACDPQAVPEDTIPVTCAPLVHDGEVCIDALRAASCASYTEFVRDDAPRVPTECEFCKRRAPGTDMGSFGADAGAGAH